MYSRCRTCKKKYIFDKSTADWQGYCSQACVKRMATQNKRSGELLPRDEYTILKRIGEIGNVPYDSRT